MRCILDDDGGNNKVEQKRGKLFRDVTLIDLSLDNDEHSNDNTNNEETVLLDNFSDDEMSLGFKNSWLFFLTVLTAIVSCLFPQFFKIDFVM